MKQTIEMDIEVWDDRYGDVELSVVAEVDTDEDGPSVDVTSCQHFGCNFDYSDKQHEIMSEVLMEEASNRRWDNF